MKLLIAILITVSSFAQTDERLEGYVIHFQDSLNLTDTKRIYKVDFGELDGDWKAHEHPEGYHIIIAKEPKKMTTRKAVIKALYVAYYKLKRTTI